MTKACCKFLVSMCVEFSCLLPKRVCLIIFAVLKILADLLGNVVFGYIGLAYILLKDQQVQSSIATFVALLLALILDIAFMIILIVAVWKRNNQLYKLTYYYSIGSLVLAFMITVINVIVIYSMDENMFKDLFGDDLTYTENFFIYASLIGIYTVVHVYMITFIKSEINNTENSRSDQENIIKLGKNSDVAYGRFD